jgi:hypothetical protein
LPWIEIISDDPVKAFEESCASLESNATASPFIGKSVVQVYEFFINHMRPPGDGDEQDQQITYSTFIVVDEECLRTEPLQCVVCSDAPDFRETKVRLKCLQISLEEAVDHVYRLEMMIMTPSEVGQENNIVSVRPPAWLMDAGDGCYRQATPKERVQNRRDAISSLKHWPPSPNLA